MSRAVWTAEPALEPTRHPTLLPAGPPHADAAGATGRFAGLSLCAHPPTGLGHHPHPP